MFEILNESVATKEKFRVAANKLLNQCFLLRKKEDTKKDYVFVREYRELFTQYFDLLGYELRVNEDQGVIGIYNTFGTGRLLLSKNESVLLLILRLLYLEKRRELSSSYEEIVVLMEEIRERYEALALKTNPVMTKTMQRETVSLFKKYNVISNLDSDVTMDGARIIIYPSVMMAVSAEDINEFYEQSENKLKEYTMSADSNDDSIEEEN